MHARPAHRRSFLAAAMFATLLLVAAQAPAQSIDPVGRLRAAFPELQSALLRDAAEIGQLGVRIVAVNERQREFGFVDSDVIVSVGGHAVAGDTWPNVGFPDLPVFTVLRSVPGQRPVLPPEVLARRVLGQFADLPAAERTPMRLARMLANQQTLVEDGVGVVLLPAALGQDDRQWLQVANPMPPRSEAAVQELRDAILERVRLPYKRDEASAANEELKKQDFHEALERVSRAMLSYVADPQQRGRREPLDQMLATWSSASDGLVVQRRELMAPSPRFGVFLEGHVSNIEAFLPQNTLISVENSTGFALNVGVRMRLLRPLDLQVGYGQVRNNFEGPQDPCDAIENDICEPDDGTRTARIKTVLHPMVAELVFRPPLLRRLKPMFRAGAGLFYISTRILDDNEVVLERATDTAFGTVLGGGVDVFYVPKHRLRGTIGGTFRLLTHTFSPVTYANWEVGENVDPEQQRKLLQELARSGGLFELDMGGWQAGFTLSYDF